MGVDCKLVLPFDVRIDDVAQVAGLLAGCKINDGGQYPRVSGVRVVCSGSATMAYIVTDSEVDDDGLNVSYHFEHRHGRLMMAHSTPLWCAVAEGLARFFGGRVDFNDCDDTDTDIEIPHPEAANNPEDGEEWHTFRARMFAVQPVERNYEAAAYKDNGRYK